MLSDNIKKYRKANNLSQEELAEKINVTRQSISLWETGKTQPSIDILVNLASVLGVTTDELLTSSNDASITTIEDVPPKAIESDNLPKDTRSRREIKGWLIGILALCLIVGAALLLNTAFKSQNSFSNNPAAIEAASESVVMLSCYDKSGELYASGSGFALIEKGIIVTNYHVIEENVYSIEVNTETGASYHVKSIVAIDEENDIAILRCAGNPDLTLLSVGDTAGLKKGEKVVAIGSPLGLINTVSTGVFSGYIGNSLLQFTASISHGSSGGALFDDNGKVLGITFASLDDGQNLNFAVPIEYALSLWGNRDKEISVQDFCTANTPKMTVVGVRTISIADEFLAKYILATMQQNNDGEDGIIAIMDTYAPEQGGGQLCWIEPGMWVAEVDDWCFDSDRKVGDFALIESAYGYTICYISSFGEKEIEQGNGLPNYNDSQLAPIPEPETAFIFESTYCEDGVAPLKIITSSEDGHYFVVDLISLPDDSELDDFSKGYYEAATKIKFYIRGGESIELNLPLGIYEIYYATGQTWYGEECLFGIDTVYHKCEGTFAFTESEEDYNGWIIELLPVENGNLATDIIDQSQFPN